jgi:HAD superfamily hydrolase (TIGR01509 family)
MIKAIIFDVDGVLEDSFDEVYEYFKSIFDQSGYTMVTEDEFREMLHIARDDMIRLIAKNPDQDEMARILEIEKDVTYAMDGIKMTDGSEDIVKALARKYRLAIVTGRNERGAEDYLKRSGLEKYFEVVVHYEHYENPKPHPEPILVALKRLNIAPEEAVYIGDTEADFQSATAAGTKFILHADNKKIDGVRHQTFDFRSLPGLIEQL